MEQRIWARTLDRNTRAGLPEISGQQNVRVKATGRDNTGENTDKGHTPCPRIEIKIPDPAWNIIRTAGLEGKDSADYSTAPD